MSCGSHRFCTSITCRPSEAALDGPGPAAVKASVDEGMSSREPSSYAVHRSSCRSSRSQSTWRVCSALDELTECERLGARWVEHHDSHLILGEELAQGPAVGVAVLIELHPLQKKMFLPSSPPPRLGTEPTRTQERWDCASPPLALTAQDSVPRITATHSGGHCARRGCEAKCPQDWGSRWWDHEGGRAGSCGGEMLRGEFEPTPSPRRSSRGG